MEITKEFLSQFHGVEWAAQREGVRRYYIGIIKDVECEDSQDILKINFSLLFTQSGPATKEWIETRRSMQNWIPIGNDPLYLHPSYYQTTEQEDGTIKLTSNREVAFFELTLLPKNNRRNSRRYKWQNFLIR